MYVWLQQQNQMRSEDHNWSKSALLDTHTCTNTAEEHVALEMKWLFVISKGTEIKEVMGDKPTF